jgi:hypothetical protein
MPPINSSVNSTPAKPDAQVPESSRLSLFGYTPNARLLDAAFGRQPAQENNAIPPAGSR